MEIIITSFQGLNSSGEEFYWVDYSTITVRSNKYCTFLQAYYELSKGRYGDWNLQNNRQKGQEKKSTMANEARSLRSCFIQAEAKRKSLEVSRDTNSATFQKNLTSVVSDYEECLKIIDQVSLISSNESLEDVSSGDLQSVYVQLALAAEYW